MIQVILVGIFNSNPGHCVEDWTFFRQKKKIIAFERWSKRVELADEQSVLSFTSIGHILLIYTNSMLSLGIIVELVGSSYVSWVAILDPSTEQVHNTPHTPCSANSRE